MLNFLSLIWSEGVCPVGRGKSRAFIYISIFCHTFISAQNDRTVRPIVSIFAIGVSDIPIVARKDTPPTNGFAASSRARTSLWTTQLGAPRAVRNAWTRWPDHHLIHFRALPSGHTKLLMWPTMGPGAKGRAAKSEQHGRPTYAFHMMLYTQKSVPKLARRQQLRPSLTRW